MCGSAELLDDADSFVAEGAVLAREMEVGAADAGVGGADVGFGGIDRAGDGFGRDVVGGGAREDGELFGHFGD